MQTSSSFLLFSIYEFGSNIKSCSLKLLKGDIEIVLSKSITLPQKNGYTIDQDSLTPVIEWYLQFAFILSQKEVNQSSFVDFVVKRIWKNFISRGFPAGGNSAAVEDGIQYILQLMSIQAEKSLSSLKKKARDEIINMHLAVFPYEVEFYSAVPFPTAIYFEKNYQILGQISDTIPSGRKREKVELSNISNIMRFRIYCESNIVYKWSIYRRGEGQEEYLDSFAINMREVVNTIAASLPVPHHRHRRNPKLSELNNNQSQMEKSGFIKKQMRLKFQKVDLCLFYTLLLARDDLQIQQYVTRKFIHKEEDAVIQQNFLKADSSMNIGLSSRKGPSVFIKKSSDPVNEHTYSNQKNNNLESSLGFNSPSAQPQAAPQLSTLKKQDPVNKATTSQNLDNIILNFDAAGTITSSRQCQLHIDSDQLDGKQKLDPELTFKDQSKSNTNEEGMRTNQATVDPGSKRDQTLFGSNRDYGMLKLESDQGRVKQDAVDKKLQMMELEAIQEDQPSKECTVNMSPLETGVSPYKNRLNKLKAKKKSTIREESTQPQLQSKKTDFKRIAIVFVLSLLIFVLAATLLKTKKDKNRAKAKPKKK